MIYQWKIVSYGGQQKMEETVIRAPTAADALAIFEVRKAQHSRGSSGPYVGDIFDIRLDEPEAP